MQSKKKSRALAAWVKECRERLGLSQKDLAIKANATQQELSKVERLGLVPDDDRLKAICDALGQSVADARKIIDESASRDDIAQFYEVRYRDFAEDLERAANGPLLTFVLREDGEPFNDAAARRHVEILTKYEQLFIIVLFRYSEPSVWQSFRLLVSAVERLWKEDQSRATNPEELAKGIEDLKRRLQGYYCNPQCEEKRSIDSGRGPLPMAHPIVLQKDSHEASLYHYEIDFDVQQRHQQAGMDAGEAEWRSICIFPGDQRRAAALFSGWIGPYDLSEQGTLSLDETLWTKIEWHRPAKKV